MHRRTSVTGKQWKFKSRTDTGKVILGCLDGSSIIGHYVGIA